MGAGHGERLTTGVAGLDEVLHGGLIPERAYLVRGGPGAGKTLLGLHFLTEGITHEETCLCLFISFGQSETKLRVNADAMGFKVHDIHFLDLTPTSILFSERKTFQFFSAAEEERGPITQQIIETMERLRPKRVVVDSVTQLRYLNPDPLQFRREMLSFLQFMTEQGVTVLLISESGATLPDDDRQFMADGIITLSGDGLQRKVAVTKYLGSDYRAGRHAVRISTDGIQVFPKLEPMLAEEERVTETVSSGIPELDALLNGGLERGSTTFISGPSGTGKTTFGFTFARGAAERGERFALFIFAERLDALIRHAEGINIPVRAMVKQGSLSIHAILAGRYTTDEFAHLVQQEVEVQHARMVMIDGVTGYRQALVGEQQEEDLHTLLDYLDTHGVTTLVTAQVENVTGDFQITEVNISYLVDTIVFLRYLEINGQIRKAIGVLKKRLSDFEKTLREFEITKYGLHLGKPFTGLRGILRGEPEWVKLPREEEQ